MGEVDLPVVVGDTSIEAALEAMRVANRCGLVTAREETYVVLTDEDLIDAFRERGHRKVAQMEPGHRTLVVSPKSPGHQAILNQIGRMAGLDQLLRVNYGHFALEPSLAPMIAVRTIGEALAYALGQRPVVCTCTDDSTHKWRPAQLSDPNKCNLDGKPVDCK